jgi:hypothetical protein
MSDKNTTIGRIVTALINVPAETLGTLLDLINRLAGDNGQEILKNLKHLLRGEFEIKLPPLIKWLGTTKTSATTEKFVAKDKFCKDSKEVKFHEIWINFISWFLADNSKIKEPISEQELRYGNLTKYSRDGSIINELGGEAKAETTLTELWDQLKKHANGEKNDLLTNRYANIFYIRDTSDALRAVSVIWGDFGWRVVASSVKRPVVWDAGCRVFARNY